MQKKLRSDLEYTAARQHGIRIYHNDHNNIQYISYKVVDSIIHSFAVHLNGVKPIFVLHYTDLNSYLYSMDLNVCGCILTYMLC